jgi:hypothetical protein
VSAHSRKSGRIIVPSASSPDLPNDCWQSDITNGELESGAKVEIINFIDDYSLAALCSSPKPGYRIFASSHGRVP